MYLITATNSYFFIPGPISLSYYCDYFPFLYFYTNLCILLLLLIPISLFLDQFLYIITVTISHFFNSTPIYVSHYCYLFLFLNSWTNFFILLLWLFPISLFLHQFMYLITVTNSFFFIRGTNFLIL